MAPEARDPHESGVAAVVDGDDKGSKTPPQRVLLDAVLREVGDAEILGAVFTTYGLDPGFFQDEVLARLMGQDSTMVRARRLLAREALGEVRPLVLYDAETLQDGQFGVGFRNDLPVHYICVRHPSGAFHPKVTLLLTGPLPGGGGGGSPAADRGDGRPEASSPQRLVVVVASANLTPSGWRRNVEISWIRVVERGQACPFRDDLLGVSSEAGVGASGLFGLLRQWCGETGMATLDAMTSLVQDTAPAGASTLPRLWYGQARLDNWLRRYLPTPGDTREVEIVAPFVSDPRPLPLLRLIRATGARRVTVRPPQDATGAIVASKAWVEAVAGLDGVMWGELPKALRSAGAGRVKESAADRYVHAKLVHIREGSNGKRAWVLSGSPNLTVRGHAGARPQDSNAEVAVLDEISSQSGLRWLEPTGRPKPAQVSVTPPEERAQNEGRFAGVNITVDWNRRSLAIQVATPMVTHVRLYATLTDSEPLTDVTLDSHGNADVAAPGAEVLLRSLESSSVLWARSSPGTFAAEAVLVREVGLLKKPDALSRELTPADILAIWATLDPYRRQVLLEEALRRAGEDAGGEADVMGNDGQTPGGIAQSREALNLFERQAGQFFAFHILRQRLRRCFATGRSERARVMVFSDNGDSVRSLAARVIEQQADLVERMVLLLCCQEVISDVRRENPVWLEAHAAEAREIQDQLEVCWEGIELPPEKRAAFRRWFMSSWPGLNP